MALTTKTEVEVYEKNGNTTDTDRDKIIIENHWNRRNFVTLNINGEKLTVVAEHLKIAIDNATNQPI